MDNLINYLLESGAALALFYIFYRLMRMEQSQFSISRAYLISAMVFSMVLPFLNFSASFAQGIYLQPDIMLEPVVAGNEGAASTSLFWSSLADSFYLIGAIVAFLLICYRIGRVLYWRSTGYVRRCDRYTLVILEKEIPPFSLFSQVFISRHTLEDKPSAQIILEHELVHIRKYHSLDNMLAGLIAAIHWFNPFIWLMQKELKRVHEYEADRRAIEKTGNYRDYQELLFRQTFGVPYLSPINNFNSFIKKRMLMLRKTSSNRNFSRALVFIPLAVALIFVFACSESGNGEVQQQEKEQKEVKKSATSQAEDQIFLAVEDMPTFQGGGVAAFRDYVQQQLTYPEEAAEKGLEGTSFVKFVVNKEGEVEDVEVIRSSHPVLDQAAVEAIKDSPEWEPGMQRGQKVKVRFTIPMVFKLAE